MTKPKTEVVFIIDESSSMDYLRDATISAFNEQLKALKI